MILLDTNVISELVKATPDPAVAAFLEALPLHAVFTAAICEAELSYGLARMPEGRRRDHLAGQVDLFLKRGFSGRILPFDSVCAKHYGAIRMVREASGRPIATEDAMIAATARANGAVLATRNIRDFLECGLSLADPWTS